ncbi:hypothetical protein QTP88_022751 [Uroleucon formosanum]
MTTIVKWSEGTLFQNGINSHLRALRVLKLPVEHWDAIIIHLIVEKLDVESHHLWESSCPNSIETRSNYGKIALPTSYATNTKQLASKKRSYTTDLAATDKSASSYTHRAQRIREIETTVLQLPPPRPYVKNMFTWILQNSLRQTPHLLHVIASTEVQVETATQTTVLLSTTVILVSSPWGSTHSARSLIDFGSQCHFITSRLVRYHSCGCKREILQQFIVIPKTIGELPVRFSRNSIQIPGDIQLADSNFWTLGSMEMIIGAEIFY